ncbi:hypothetical protein FH972_010320 [Carpinus fangiana]|uniref:Uncharacterized protein n=1 Tax=Carpinus fangiana TaxID=176857 RepID=A0A660KUW4_9ROSI|nr:hypothetical protein FH972_010320 [Carpinus fangiana]
MALVVAARVCIEHLLTTMPKHDGACLGLRKRVGLDLALLPLKTLWVLTCCNIHVLSYSRSCCAISITALGQNGVLPCMQDMVKWLEDGWAFMKAWCVAGRPVGLPCGSKHNRGVDKRQPCTAWMLADNSNSNCGSLLAGVDKLHQAVGWSQVSSPLQQQGSPS